MNLNERKLGANMAFVLLVGAANSDATPEQRQELRKRVTPLLDGYRADGDPRPVFEAVRSVLGPSWRPNEEWARSIDAMLPEQP